LNPVYNVDIVYAMSENIQETRDPEAITDYGAVEELEFTDEFLEHMSERGTYEKHLVTIGEVLEVHAGVPRYFLNASTGRAPIVMVGPTHAERMLCVPLEPVANREGVWRPVTAFEANAHHRARYRQAEE
jgi:hypothetical protein